MCEDKAPFFMPDEVFSEFEDLHEIIEKRTERYEDYDKSQYVYESVMQELLASGVEENHLAFAGPVRGSFFVIHMDTGYTEYHENFREWLKFAVAEALEAWREEQ